MSPWEKLLERPDPHGHLVQIYSGGDEQHLARNVGQYLFEGFKRNDGLLVIADAFNTKLFQLQLEQAGIDTELAIHTGQLFFADAQETLSRFMRNGQPDWNLFEEVAGTAMRQVRPEVPGAGLRAYGEMVGILWKAGQYSAAIRLEQFWNKLLGQSSFSLFCGYAIDVFGKDFQICHLDALLCTHTHMLPGANGHLEPAINMAMDEILGPNADDLKLLIKANFRPSWAVMPRGESTVLWLRNNLPQQADQILARAREHYRAMHSH
jgi:hypothetical protein